jgi:long-chain acyl-CoA synthetase
VTAAKRADRLGDALTAWDAPAVPADAAPRAAALLETASACFGPPSGGAAPPLSGAVSSAETALAHRFLEMTGTPAFLGALPDPETRARWAEVACGAIRRSHYTLETMLTQRAATLGGHALFEEFGRALPVGWSYGRVLARARAFAAAFLSASESGAPPRVALYLDNSVDGACCDLACLLHDILVTPLNIHFGTDELSWIFDRLGITVAVTDDEERLRHLLEVQRRSSHPFTVFALKPNRIVDRGDARLLGEVVARMTPSRVDGILAARRRRGLDEIGTVMFTSGSTGRPKGVAFTPFNLVSKRFARAAALPDVGQDEVLLCYLPLFHTFGRYLEMLGSIFWRGTYVFAGNPSTETLLAGLRQVRPTGLISIPLRWTQIRDRTLEAMASATSPPARDAAFRSVVGDRLRWGLSAAGYLEPKVFQHFNHFGVGLCSGFGMTEATGGITMSPPGDYLPDSVGVPLPAIRVRLSAAGEMQIAGPYVARHLADEGDELELEPALAEDGEEWLATGDLFRGLDRGHLTIVDRIKDIYKNDRGQTIAPQRVERKFHGVPGIRRTFLVGDHRSYNVLLIVPDPDDPVLRDAPDDGSRQEYFHRIVAAANENLAPYERVVNFALLERDLDLERGELTPKGSYRRQIIEQSFAGVIDGLYQSPWVEIPLGGIRMRIPRWLFRDLGILENDLRADDGALRDRRRGLRLPLRREPGEPLLRLGDLDYRVEGDVVDLGVFARQPRLWMGNPAFIRFAPCKEGWDVATAGVSGGVLLPRTAEEVPDRTVRPHGIRDPHLLEVNDLLHAVLFGPAEEALAALESLTHELTQSDDRLSAVIRSRIAALARHGDQRLRCLAYRTLLLDEPTPGYEVSFPSFVESGLPFLDEESIAAIALARFEQRRLQLLRQRLLGYRARMPWPAAEHTREQFRSILSLLASFARNHPDYYKPVRAELTCWVLHHEDPPLATLAQGLLDELARWFEARLERETGPRERDRLRAGIQFDEEIPDADRERLRHLLVETGFLRESVILTFDEQDFDLEQVADDGLWLSRMQSRGQYQLYRLSVNTRRQRHFDLLVILRSDMDATAVRLTNYWMVAIGDHPLGDRTLPRFGCVRADLAAMSLEYVREPNVAERIHVLASAEDPRGWRRLYVRALAAFFRAWHDSARRIVPGALDPVNVAVSDVDYQEGALILSLAGWEPYGDTLSLFRPICRTFYTKTRMLYPAGTRALRFEWIFEACVEALGAESALELLARFGREAREAPEPLDPDLLASLDEYLARFPERYHPPLSLANAIDRYGEWSRDNAGATDEARAQLLDQLMDLYRLERFGELARYHLYRHTFFAAAAAPVLEAYDRLLDALRAGPARSATERVELSDLQAALVEQGDRDLFSRLVFPRARGAQRIEVLTFGDSEHPLVTVKTHFADAQGETFDFREPVEPEEVGQLYRLFFQERFPKTVSELDRHLIVVDATERLVGGLSYRMDSPQIAHLDGIVVNAALTARGIATALLEDFAVRMASRGVKVLRTSFIMRAFCERRGFKLDRRWGGLVRVLSEEG